MYWCIYGFVKQIELIDKTQALYESYDLENSFVFNTVRLALFGYCGHVSNGCSKIFSGVISPFMESHNPAVNVKAVELERRWKILQKKFAREQEASTAEVLLARMRERASLSRKLAKRELMKRKMRRKKKRRLSRLITGGWRKHTK
jgi:hypothetical protein